MTASGSAQGAGYPVSLEVTPDLTGRNRLTTAFRIILAIPHLILVGGPAAIGASWSLGWRDDGLSFDSGGTGGVLGAVAAVCAVISWFAIVFTGQHPRGLWDLSHLYLRWRVRAVAYTALLRDEYPPFGDGTYPTTFEVTYPRGQRDRLSVGLRIVYAIPHLLVLWALHLAWFVTSVIAWFAILFTARYPRGLYSFGVGVMRWTVRVEAYLLLMRDEYPPFSLA